MLMTLHILPPAHCCGCYNYGQ